MGISLTAWTAAMCADTIPIITISGCAGHALPIAGTATGTGAAGGTIVLTNLYLRCAVAGGPNACYYLAAAPSGVYANANATLTFTNQGLAHMVPAGATDDLGGALCGGAANLTASVIDQKIAAGTTVLLNTTP